MRGILRFLGVTVVAVAFVGGIGLLIAALADRSVKDSVAWTMWIAGGLIVFVTASSGSPAEMMTSTRTVVGGRFTDSPPLPQSPLQYALIGLVCIAVGTVIFIFD